VPSNNFVVAVHASWAVSDKRYSSMKPSLRRHLTNLGETAPPNFWLCVKSERLILRARRREDPRGWRALPECSMQEVRRQQE
jgi:hypothetical protein